MKRMFLTAGLACAVVRGQDEAPEPPPPPPALVELYMLAQAIPPKPAPAPAAPGAPFKWEMERRGSEDRLNGIYSRGMRSLDKRQWDAALESFSEVAAAKGAKADGALHWKAYALAKLGRNTDALAALAELQRSFPSSRWLNDAKSLEAEVKQASGRPLSPENQDDEDLKLMAINSLINSDPDRAIPLLEKLLNRQSSQRLRERALFVLAQSRTPQAREIVVQFAKGKGNPDLQLKAVEYLGIHGGGNNLQVLGEIYSSTQDTAVKGRILQSYMMARDKQSLLQAARTETNPTLKRDAIHLLGTMNAGPELAQLYSSEQSLEVKEALIEAFMISNQGEKLIEIAKGDKDPKVRRKAVQRLGHVRRTPTASDALVAMYGSESDKAVRREILNAFSHQNDATRLIEIARKEPDQDLKREAVQRLAHMKSKEATDYLMEILNK